MLNGVLVALLAVLVPLGATAVWADRVLADEDAYVAAMSPLAGNPKVRGAVARQATEAIDGQLDAGPFQPAVRALLGEAVDSFVGTASFRTAWNAANRAAHAAFFTSLDSGTGNKVSVDLAPVIAQVKDDLAADGVPFVEHIPESHTVITVMEYENLGALRRGFHVLQIAGIWLPVGALVLTAAAVALSARRRTTLVAAGVGLAAGALLLAAAVPLLRGLTLDDLPADVDRDAAGAVYDALTAFLRTTAWVVLAAGVALALGAWLAGLRRRTRTP